MSGSIHDAIESRWAATSALASLVPIKNSGVGKFPAERADEIAYPYVSREIQDETDLWNSSDNRCIRAMVLFRCWSWRHEDGRAFRVAWNGGTSTAQGFEKKAFTAGGIYVLNSREANWQEFQEPDGMWTFFLLARMDYIQAADPNDPVDPDPDPDPGEDEEDTLLFRSITPVTVSGTASPGNLLHATDIFAVDANTWDEGEVLSGEIDGVYGTMDENPGGLAITLSVGGADLVFDVPDEEMPGAQSVEGWVIRWSLTRSTTGASGLIFGSGTLWMTTASGEVIVAIASTGASPVILSSLASAAIGLEVDWETADAANTITRNQCYGRIAGV